MRPNRLWPHKGVPSFRAPVAPISNCAKEDKYNIYLRKYRIPLIYKWILLE